MAFTDADTDNLAVGYAYGAADNAMFVASVKKDIARLRINEERLLNEDSIKEVRDNSYRWVKAMMKEIAGLISI